VGVACSREAVNIVSTMFRKLGNYSGPFCTEFKADNQQHIRFIEVNARLCGGTVHNDLFFLATYVPYAVRVREMMKTGELPANANADFSNDWYTSNPVFARIVEVEKKTMMSGGGIIRGRWVSVDKFNSTNELDGGISPFFAYRIDPTGRVVP
jgi:hypothetical protein